MSVLSRHVVNLLLVAIAAPLFAASATAQPAYPDKTIRIVVPFNAGGPVDQLARVVAAKLPLLLGQPAIVENRGGAATIIGWDAVAKAPADGYTLLMAGVGGRTILPSVANLPYDPAKDLTPVTRVANSPNVFVVNASRPLKTLKEFVAFAKPQPGRLNAGLAAPGTLTHFAGTLLQRDAGIALTEVPYRGGAPAVTALLSGEIDFMVADAGAVMPYIQAGKLTVLAVADSRRLPFLPLVPTAPEAGFPNLVAVNVYGLYAPAGTPKPVIDRVAHTVDAILKQADVQEVIAKLGMVAQSSTPEAFETLHREQTLLWAPLAKASGVRVN
ncbi:tripartite tricarboxylate transporter substrate binding protein [uncultured Hydrogenophaga sp.]|uniref:Bug family tripartite tricarboxylate transporter substrate binding protein n=1 Tax=uncultured Hydrogenophaga sp. TaxID=199683 RepID=UPI00258B337A|nr:tripartite tricarboxylate transporter substrate binding protein [uncultured Hydrogenophaga sp.]